MKVIVTGGAGFIGCNAASRYLRRGDAVVVLDNLSRVGANQNVEWLRTQGRLTFLKLDIRHKGPLNDAFRAHSDAGLILHLAAQPAVTTSVANPQADFEVNALGTLNVLEAVRHAKLATPVIYSSTNKVYGSMEDLRIVERDGRYCYADLPCGVREDRNLDFHSPYGCSKGAADQYVRDYHRIYDLRTVVFRQSCIYGPRQFGVEDQGWVAWFTIATQMGRGLTVYGDGKQTRDVLFIDDLLDAFDAALSNIDTANGKLYNIGGGAENVLSLLDLLDYLGSREGRPVAYKRDGWRPGDQKVYVSDIGQARADLGWAPRVGRQHGLDRLHDWVSTQRPLFQ